MALTICIPDGQGKLRCKSIPVVLKPRWPWPPIDPWTAVEAPWELSFLERVRISLAVLFLRPRDPWRSLGVALPDTARRELAILSAVDALAARLGPGAREVLQATLPGAAARVALPAGVEVRWEAER